MRENRRQKRQNIIDNRESKRSVLQAERENISSAKDKNSNIGREIKVVKNLYKNQIKLAESENDSLEVSRLKAEKEKEIRDLKIEQHQNTADELESELALLSAKKENALSAEEKNKIVDQELETKKSYMLKRKQSPIWKEIQTRLTALKRNTKPGKDRLLLKKPVTSKMSTVTSSMLPTGEKQDEFISLHIKIEIKTAHNANGILT